MPRRGIIGRLTGFLKKITGSGQSPVVAKPQTDRTEPPPPGGDVIRTESRHEVRMRQIFENITRPTHDKGSGTYEDWRDIYDPMSVNFIDESDADATARETEQYWDEFLRSYYLTSHESGSVPRDQFHRDSGIPRRRVDWEEWRNSKRGTP